MTGTDGSVWHAWQASPNGAWVPVWTPRLEVAPPRRTLGLSAMATRDGGLELVALRDDGVVVRSADPGGGARWPVTELRSPAGEEAVGPGGLPVSGHGAEGRIEVFVIDERTGALRSASPAAPGDARA